MPSPTQAAANLLYSALASNTTSTTATGLKLAEAGPPSLQVASLFFFLSALFNDILLIRLCLAIAFLALTISKVLTSASTGTLIVDGLGWSLCTGIWHWHALWSLAAEEVPHKFTAADDDEALFAFLHRRTGMPRNAFQRLLTIGEWVHFAPGERICETRSSRNNLYFLVQGRARHNFEYEDGTVGEKLVRSGECFDLRILNCLGVFLGFPNKRFECSALERTEGAGGGRAGDSNNDSGVLCFRLPLQGLLDLMQADVSLRLGFSGAP